MMAKARSSSIGFAWNFIAHDAQGFVNDGLGDGNIDTAIKPHLDQL
jgi:hypothetical protein